MSADPSDVRLKLMNKGDSNPAAQTYDLYILKYTNGGSDVQNSNIMVHRLSEAYLIAAEAAVKLSDNGKAVQYLDPIVNRANPANNVTGTVTLTMVLDEKRKEFFGEGHRSFDLLRNNMKIIRTGPGHSDVMASWAAEIDWNQYRIVLPVPRHQMESNPNMVQNPGWGN